jgi:DNA repair exonuclease SbcCD ATPase subunit
MWRPIKSFLTSIKKAEKKCARAELKAIRASKNQRDCFDEYLMVLNESEDLDARISEATEDDAPHLAEWKAELDTKEARVLALRAKCARLREAEEKADKDEDDAIDNLERIRDDYEAFKSLHGLV